MENVIETKEENKVVDSLAHRFFGVIKMLTLGTGLMFVLFFMFKPDSRGIEGLLLFGISYLPMFYFSENDSKGRRTLMTIVFLIIVGILTYHGYTR